ncbi:glycosyltransferase family 2 protein [Gilvibacter sediminis]|uniref:glycosyltransferase family 2 protein n=1 Tax=Gilvibacter sediminis TaxID=379071 RepID=UPI002350B0E6|nr:glycosyltransferase family 2 protein [Gilvibacter sediminis]MDC7998465.1 glycosyltransferase family 2 protein [Gilvibacter sediminis]
MADPVKLSLVIPLYNEEDNVAPLTAQVAEALKGFSYELIYIDDCSTDNTRAEILKLGHEQVHLIELKKNYGQSMALAAGIDYASGDFIVTLDGDMQNDPADIPAMLAKMEAEDWDMITGFRKNRKDSFLKKIPSKIANFIIRKATKFNVKDQGCALKIFRAETAKELNLYGEMHRFISLLTYLNGARITQVAVNHRPRQFGKSKYGLGRTVKVVNDVILILFQRNYLQKPMYLFGNLGLLFFGLGVIINAYLLYEKLIGNEIGDRPLVFVGVLFVLMGIQFYTSGIIIDLQMRTYFESQKQKPFKIRKIHKPKG